MAELGPLSVKNEDVLNRALPVAGGAGTRFIAGRLRSTIGAEQSRVGLAETSEAEKRRRPSPGDPATVLRAFADDPCLPDLGNVAGLTALRPIAKGLQRSRHDTVIRGASLTDASSRDALQRVRELGGDEAVVNQHARLELSLGRCVPAGATGGGPCSSRGRGGRPGVGIVPDGQAEAVTTPLGTPRPARPGGSTVQ